LPNPERAASSPRLRQLRILSLADFAILTAAGIAALYFQLSLPRRLPSEGDYRDVAAALAKESKEGDVVLLYPWWAERARLFVPRSLPVVGYLGSDTDPLRTFPRIWVLAQPNLPRSDVKAFERRFIPGRAALGSPRRFGNLELSLYRNSLYRPIVFSAAAEHASARVYIEEPDHRQLDCPFDGKVHRCPGPEQLRVDQEWHEVLYEPRHCLWMHPPGGSRRLVAEFLSAKLGEKLALSAGIVGEYASRRQPELTVTHAVVEELTTGRRLLEIAIPPGREGMQQVETPSQLKLPASMGLKVWVQSDNRALRETCLELFSDRSATP
jgi:hypothetical protein